MRDFKNKKVLVMGLGLHGGGAGTVEFLKKEGAKITVTDLRSAKELRPTLKKLKKYRGIKWVLGKHRPQDFLKADLIIKNPGVRPYSPFLKLAKLHRIPVTSDIGIFFKNCPAPIIGVSGTRGKSTTAFLIASFLKNKFRRVFLGGNIRKSVLEILGKIKPKDVAVLELSSFQLWDLAQEKISPPVAVLTNVFADHLNWHKNFADYLRAKSYIFKFQKKEDLIFANGRDKILRCLVSKAPSRKIFARPPSADLEKSVEKNLGAHYKEAAALAWAVGKYFGAEEKQMRRILKNFRGLEGRQEIITKIKGITFVNDTASTMPEATLAALKRFSEITSRRAKIILIAGGEDKGLNYKKLAKVIKKETSLLVLLPGSATEKIKKMLGTQKNAKDARSMKEAVKMSFRSARSGDYILLSPGAASFGLFLNEFDRGEKFNKAVRALK